MKRTIGNRDNAQTRRRARRAAARRETLGLDAQDIRDIQALTAEAVDFAATGSTDLPLSDQDTAWDAGAAAKGLDASDLSKAFFWRDPDGDASNKSSYKLGFAQKVGGTLTAIWRGVTAAAGAIQGARGGVQIPDGDVAGVKAKIASYYAKAATKYGDDSIKPPWEANESAGETAAFLLAYADSVPGVSTEKPEADMVFLHSARLDEDGHPDETSFTVYSTDEMTFDLFEMRFAYWEAELTSGPGWGDPDANPVQDIIDTIEEEVFGGKPNKGTKPDKRLKENDPDKPKDEATIDAIDAWASAVRCSCGHSYAEHSGAGGTCAHEDGRGTCSCGEFAYPDQEISSLADAIIAVRPDLAEFQAEVMRIAERTLLSLQAAAGDVAWGPEDGFVDLLCDVNETLSNGMPGQMGPRAIDAGVKLDKVLICDRDDYFVAPITIDANGEPVLADKTDWKHVENGWIETPDDDTDEAMTSAAFREAMKRWMSTFAPVVEVPVAEERIPEASDEIREPEAPAAQEGDIPWHATFVPEGKLTEDGRAFAPGSVLIPGQDEGARDLPLTLMAMIETSAEGGHDGAKVAGRIDSLYRTAPDIEADGVFSHEEWGQMIARMVENKELKGLSVDIAPLDYSWVPRDQFFGEDGGFIGVWNDEAGEWAPAPGTEHLSEEDEDDPLARFFGEDDRVLLITKAVIGMATVCPFPAFGDASISLTAAGMPRSVIIPLQMEMPAEALTAAGIPLCAECRGEVEVVESEATGRDPSGRVQPTLLSADEPVLTAAAAGLAPLKPPADWFADPEFEELTPITITDDGRIYGHAWAWESCHLSFDRCVTAPHSETNYGFFLFGELECEDGERLNVGKITYDTGHAGVRLSRLDAVKHYDNTGTVAAHVQFGEDEFGGWFAGALCPDMPEEDIRILRASQISGDWRGIDGNLELVALLAVNLGGFPVPRGAVTASGDAIEPLALVAAGVVDEPRIAEIRRLAAEVEPTPSPEELREKLGLEPIE